jgi:hypothetical protein
VRSLKKKKCHETATDSRKKRFHARRVTHETCLGVTRV